MVDLRLTTSQSPDEYAKQPFIIHLVIQEEMKLFLSFFLREIFYRAQPRRNVICMIRLIVVRLPRGPDPARGPEPGASDQEARSL